MQTPCYQYSLGKIRIKCPQCGQRTFKPYVDNDGEMLSPEVGRCNRQFSCAYHKKPREYFKEHADRARPPFTAAVRQPQRLCPSLIPMEYLNASFTKHIVESPVFRLMERYFSLETAVAVTHLYFLGYDCRSNYTHFWLIDHKFNCRSGKFMVYQADGHRDRSLPYAFRWAHSMFKDFRYVGCFYGSHLIRDNVTVVIVESEKTALVVTAWLLERGLNQKYTVVATGGCSGAKIDPDMMFDPAYKYYPVRGKNVIMIPDGDSVGLWRDCASQLSQFARSVRLWDIRRFGVTKSDDICDIILRRINRLRSYHQHNHTSLTPKV